MDGARHAVKTKMAGRVRWMGIALVSVILMSSSAFSLPLRASASGQVVNETATETPQCGHASLQARIDTAAPGDTLVVLPGTYHAPLLIDKPLTLEGQGWPVIQGDGSGDVIRITAPYVTVRGFEVRGSGKSLDREDAGIRSSGANTVLEKTTRDCVVRCCGYLGLGARQ